MGDYSIDYTEDNKGYIFFNLVNKTVKFKPFIDSFSFTFTSNIASDEELNIYNRETLVDSYNPSEYSLKFNVVATNVDEAIENHQKFQKLLRMILPMQAESLDTPKKITALFSNLISSTGQSGTNYFSKARAFDCIISDLNYTPDMEMGFFEYNGLFFAKAYALDVKMSSTEKSSRDIDSVPYFKSGFDYGRKSKIRAKLKSEEKDKKIILVVEKETDDSGKTERSRDAGGDGFDDELFLPTSNTDSALTVAADENPVVVSTSSVSVDETTNISSAEEIAAELNGDGADDDGE